MPLGIFKSMLEIKMRNLNVKIIPRVILRRRSLLPCPKFLPVTLITVWPMERTQMMSDFRGSWGGV